jgi:hypothetical protein
LGTDLSWDHECDGRLFRMSFVMATFSPPILVFNPNLKMSVMYVSGGIYEQMKDMWSPMKQGRCVCVCVCVHIYKRR